MSHNHKLLASILIGIVHLFAKPIPLAIYSLFYFGFSIAPAKAEDNILVIHSHHSELSWTKEQQLEIEEGFAEINSDNHVYHEFLDSKRHPKLGHQQEFINYINKKYIRIPIDLVMVVDDPSLELILEQRKRKISDASITELKEKVNPSSNFFDRSCGFFRHQKHQTRIS